MSLSGPAEWMSTNGVGAADAAGTASSATVSAPAITPTTRRSDSLPGATTHYELR